MTVLIWFWNLSFYFVSKWVDGIPSRTSYIRDNLKVRLENTKPWMESEIMEGCGHDSAPPSEACTGSHRFSWCTLGGWARPGATCPGQRGQLTSRGNWPLTPHAGHCPHSRQLLLGPVHTGGSRTCPGPLRLAGSLLAAAPTTPAPHHPSRNRLWYCFLPVGKA